VILYLKNKAKQNLTRPGNEGVAQVAQGLHNKCGALGSVPNSAKKKKKM
jgi:hypothetical protein